jgi:dTMP kinase
VFVSFEGIEGCGKSTQVELLGRFLAGHGVPHLITREPGGTRLGELIRQILLDPGHSEMDALTEMFLYAADRAQHTAQVIRPALETRQWIVCDRFADATAAYQGYGRGQDLVLIQRLNQWATRGLWPSLTVLLDCPVEIGLERVSQRIGDSNEDRLECQAETFHQRVRDGYLELAAREPERFTILDATLSPEQVHREVVSVLRPSL